MTARACSVDGCNRTHRARGWCLRHYRRWVRWGNPLGSDPVIACQVPGCEGKHKGRGYCGRHYQRWVKWGDPLILGDGTTPRSAVVRYATAHDRLTKDRGRAATHLCVECGEQAAEWAYDHDDPGELTESRAGVLMTYSLDQSHYRPMCVPCHRAFDSVRELILAAIRAAGGEATPLQVMAVTGLGSSTVRRHFSAVRAAS